MTFKSFKNLLEKWKETGIINEEQADKIENFMKERHRQQFMKLIKSFFCFNSLTKK